LTAEPYRRAALAAVSANGNAGAPQRAIPPPPSDLEVAGAAAWTAVWSLSRVEPADAVTVERLCRLEDEAARLRAIVAADGHVLGRPLQSAKGEVVGEERYAHPALAQLRRIGKEAAELSSVLGLSPAGRHRMGLSVSEAPTAPDALDEIRKRHALRRGEPDPGIDPRRLQ
jgi:hypothetical protein